MSDPDIEMPSYPETSPPTAQTNSETPRTPRKFDDETASPSKRFGKPLKPAPTRCHRPRAASSSSLPNGGRFSTPAHYQQVADFAPPCRVEKRRAPVRGHQRAESFEQYISSTRRLTRRIPSNDEITAVGSVNSLLPHRGQNLAPTSGSLLWDSPQLPRHQVMEQLEHRVEDLQVASQGESTGPRFSEPSDAVACSIRVRQINASRRAREDSEEGASPVVPARHGSDESH
ncbi:uncharacterized protein FTJAE_7232 [Fusarium tjaetaba]|uniref:Uncharacterized protein n=1 Tax=Fusarium tjaetaba TaxID=1567544 RepID=A0A8H5RHL6_9HYPO|nr:uncharacterized protein FTJAE_7232 [Fusarium tjaetaba]KAF5633268.1 hypothetical protein FTJAE_7232 [Fusarium tjaetaba]